MADRGRGLLVITELFLPTKGGTAVWFDEVYRRIGGKEIHIVTAEVPGGAEHDRDHANTIHRVRLRRHRWLRPESLVMYLKLLWRSVRIAGTQPVGAVHAGRVLPEGLIALAVGRLRRRPVVIYAHGEEITTWRQPMKCHAMRFCYRRADRVVANSAFTRDQLLGLGVVPGRIAVIHPGVDVERFRPDLAVDDLRASLGLSPGARLVLSVGRLSRRKGFDRVIGALPRLLARGVDVHYAIIGTGEDRGYLTELAERSQMAERVHLLGHVTMADLPRWYNACDLFAMPNREIDGDTEGFGMVFLEAAACGKPVVAGDAGGTASAVVPGETGIRVDGHDPDAVAESLFTLLDNETLRTSMARTALRRAQAHFGWEQVAARTVAELPCGGSDIGPWRVVT